MKNLREVLQSEKLIVMASQEYPIDSKVAFWGGMGVVTKEVSERLVKKGFEVLVVPRRVKEYTATHNFYQEQNGVNVLSLPLRPFKAGYENRDLYDIYPIKDGTTALDHSYTTWRFLQKHGLSRGIVHSHDWLSVAFTREAKRMGLKSVFTVHLSQLRESGMRDKRLELEKLAGENSDIIHFVSLSQMRSCQVYGWKRKKVVIPNGVDIEKYIPPKEHPIEEYVLYIGRLSPVKNVPQLILGWSKFNREFPDVKLKILGASGTSNTDVKRIINTLDAVQKAIVELRIEMVPEEERIKYYQNSSVCAFPSSQEAFGIVALEAEACGKPVVVGDVGGFKENVLEGVTGVHVEGSLPSSIASGLKEAYINKQSWGNNARKLTTIFYSWDAIVDKYVKLLYRD